MSTAYDIGQAINLNRVEGPFGVKGIGDSSITAAGSALVIKKENCINLFAESRQL